MYDTEKSTYLYTYNQMHINTLYNIIYKLIFLKIIKEKNIFKYMYI